PLAALRHAGVDLARYVGSHPMAGSEQSGPMAASEALFAGRVWALTPHETSRAHAVETVRRLAVMCGAAVVTLDPAEHDAAVARDSHLPHLLSSLAASQLHNGPGRHLELAGQGLRDVTRIAAGDPRLWGQILTANAEEVSELLQAVRMDIDRLLETLTNQEPDMSSQLERLLARGVRGTELIPG